LYQVFVATKLLLLKLYFPILNFKKMKKQIFSFKQFVILLVSLSIVIFACQHDMITPEPDAKALSTVKNSPENKAAIDDAKNWFEKNYTLITIPSIKIEPVWKQALVMGNTIEVPYLLNGVVVRPKLKKNGAFGMQDLIFVKKGTDNYKIFSMGYAPNSNYLSKMNEINYSNYRQKQFDGALIVSNLDFRILKSYNFEKGKRINAVELKKVNPNNASLRGEICFNDIVFLGCTSICIDNIIMGMYFGELCFTECYWEQVWTCNDDGLGNSGDCPGNPWCDDDGDNCPGMPECDDDDGCGGCPDDDVVTLEDDEYVCDKNFSFSAINESGSMKQQAGISGLYADLEYKLGGTIQPPIHVSMPSLYFAIDFHSASGTLIVDHSTAATNAAAAINFGEEVMRARFRGTPPIQPVRDPIELANIWNNAINLYCSEFANYNISVSDSRIITDHTPQVKAYMPCN
jgi:hypothetical protein